MSKDFCGKTKKLSFFSCSPSNLVAPFLANKSMTDFNKYSHIQDKHFQNKLKSMQKKITTKYIYKKTLYLQKKQLFSEPE